MENMVTFTRDVRNANGSSLAKLPTPDGSGVEVEFNAERLSRTKKPGQRVSWNAHSRNGQELSIGLARVINARRVIETFTIEIAEVAREREAADRQAFSDGLLDVSRRRLVEIVSDVRRDFARAIENMDRQIGRLQLPMIDDAERVQLADEILGDLRQFTGQLRSDLIIKYSRDIAVRTKQELYF